MRRHTKNASVLALEPVKATYPLPNLFKSYVSWSDAHSARKIYACETGVAGFITIFAETASENPSSIIQRRYSSQLTWDIKGQSSHSVLQSYNEYKKYLRFDA